MTGNGFIIGNIKIVEAASRMWRVKWTQISAAGWWISEGIPVHSACIHRIPVQLSKPTQVDGDARMYTPGFLSNCEYMQYTCIYLSTTYESQTVLHITGSESNGIIYDTALASRISPDGSFSWAPLALGLPIA